MPIAYDNLRHGYPWSDKAHSYRSASIGSSFEAFHAG